MNTIAREGFQTATVSSTVHMNACMVSVLIRVHRLPLATPSLGLFSAVQFLLFSLGKSLHAV